MADVVKIAESKIQELADAVRTYVGSSDSYTLEQMAEAISGGGQVTDLTGTTWYFNDTIDMGSGFTYLAYNDMAGMGGTYEIQFTNSSLLAPGQYITFSTGLAPGDIQVYNANSQTWANQAYRTITITGGTDVTNTNLINWLYANATLVSRS